MYRRTLIPHLAIVLAAVIGLQACDAGFEDMNRNPNAPEVVPVAFILPRAQETTATRLYSMSGMNGYIGAIWAQGYAKIQYTDEDRYDFSGRIALVNNLWQSFYAATLEDLNQISLIGQEENRPNVVAVAEIMKAFNFHQITDLWGDVPYEHALQGADGSTPAYTPQAEIYTGLISDLNAAIAMIDVGGPNPFGSADLVYGGDMQRWLRFAHSLKLRIAMRMSEANPSLARSTIESVYNGGNYFQSHADNAVFRFQQFPYNNPVHDFARTREDHKVSKTTVDILLQMEDPRLRIYAEPVRDEDLRTAGTMYQGVRNADANNSMPLGQVSTMGRYFVAPESPGRFMTYDEVLFILAEAAARGWLPISAEQTYYNAIRANMELYNADRLGGVLGTFSASDQAFTHQGFSAEDAPDPISEAEITAYLARPDVQWNQGQWQQRIGLQKWLALYGEGFQQWTEWRRLGVPTLTVGPLAVLTEVPRRLSYPVIEQSLNRENWTTAVSKFGAAGDTFLGRVWWDQ
jgi:hypothetical protein